MSEQLFEFGDDGFEDEFASIKKRLQDKFATHALDSIVKDWLEDRICLHLHFRTSSRTGNFEPGEYCADLQPAATGLLTLDLDLPVFDDFAVEAFDARPRQSNSSVLVPVIQGREASEQVVARRIRSVVRLVPLKECQRFRTNSRQSSVDVFEKVFTAAIGRESDLVGLGIGETEGDVVKSGAVVARNIPNEQTEFSGKRLNSRNTCNKVAFSLHLFDEVIKLTLNKRARDLVSRFQMLCAPNDFCSRG